MLGVLSYCEITFQPETIAKRLPKTFFCVTANRKDRFRAMSPSHPFWWNNRVRSFSNLANDMPQPSAPPSTSKPRIKSSCLPEKPSCCQMSFSVSSSAPCVRSSLCASDSSILLLAGLETQTQNAAFFERKRPKRKPWHRGKSLK